MRSVSGYIEGVFPEPGLGVRPGVAILNPVLIVGVRGACSRRRCSGLGCSRSPVWGLPQLLGRVGGSDGAYPLQRAWAGQREPRPPNQALLRSAPLAAKECRPRAGEQRPGEGPASKEQAAAAGGGPWPPRRAADTVRNSSRPGGRWDCLEPLPDQLFSQPQAAPSPRSHPPRRAPRGQLPAVPDPRCSMPRSRRPTHALRRRQG